MLLRLLVLVGCVPVLLSGYYPASDVYEAESCAESCLVRDSVRSFQASLTLNTIMNSSLTSLYQAKSKLFQLCRQYNTYKACLARCGQSPYQQVLRLGLSVPQFICDSNYQEFYRYLPCWFGQRLDMEEKCIGSGKGGANTLSHPSRAVQIQFSDNEQKALKDMCLTLLKVESCQRQMLESRCGAPAATLLWKIQLHSHQTMGQVLQNLPPHMQSTIPGICRTMLSVNRRKLDKIYELSTSAKTAPVLGLSASLLLIAFVIGL